MVFPGLLLGGFTEGVVKGVAVVVVAVRGCCEEAHLEKAISKNTRARPMLFEVYAGILNGNISATLCK